MKDYCLSKKNNTNYSLSGICVHSGGLNGGHYYAMCKNHQNNQWYKFNDTHVSSVSLDQVLNEDAYCLFYIRN